VVKGDKEVEVIYILGSPAGEELSFSVSKGVPRGLGRGGALRSADGLRPSRLESGGARRGGHGDRESFSWGWARVESAGRARSQRAPALTRVLYPGEGEHLPFLRRQTPP